MDIRSSEICICCNSHNFIEYNKKSFFNLPVLKCNNCLTHFIQFEKKVNLENFYKEEYWEDFRREDREKSKPEIKNRVIQTINQILLNLVKMTGVQQSRSFSQYTLFKS